MTALKVPFWFYYHYPAVALPRHPFASEGEFVRLTSTNHPVRLRFAAARHPST
ncbi:MAG: hypothetical protein LBB23_02225 [Rickettsiales bacterium]|nr:hypothetical protein [Rickettsiales bacterium]